MHKVRGVVTKEWRKAKSAETGIFICFSCGEYSSFRLNILGPRGASTGSSKNITILGSYNTVM